jgi:hypothetical protein
MLLVTVLACNVTGRRRSSNQISGLRLACFDGRRREKLEFHLQSLEFHLRELERRLPPRASPEANRQIHQPHWGRSMHGENATVSERR